MSDDGIVAAEQSDGAPRDAAPAPAADTEIRATSDEGSDEATALAAPVGAEMAANDTAEPIDAPASQGSVLGRVVHRLEDAAESGAAALRHELGAVSHIHSESGTTAPDGGGTEAGSEWFDPQGEV